MLTVSSLIKYLKAKQCLYPQMHLETMLRFDRLLTCHEVGVRTWRGWRNKW